MNMKNPISVKNMPSGVKATSRYVKDLFVAGPDGMVGKGLELGVGAVLAKTVLRRLPVPLNFIAPYLIEKVIMKHGIDAGRDILLNGLRWVKQATDEKPKLTLEKVRL